MDVAVIGDRAARGVDNEPWRVLDGFARVLTATCPPWRRSPAAAPPRRGAAAAGDPQSDGVSPATAWLLDHFKYLQLTIRETRDMLPRRYFRDLPRDGATAGAAVRTRQPNGAEPRIRRLARELVARSPERLDEDTVAAFFEEAQAADPLTLAELWAIAPMLRLALFERLRDEVTGGRASVDGPDQGAAPTSAGDGEKVRAIILALRSLDKIRWRELTESVCALDKVLRRDPTGVYPRMDFDTRDSYRRAVERVARHSAAGEQEVAALAVDLAASGDDERTRHVGYYLVGKGSVLLEERAGCRNSLRARIGRTMRRGRGIGHLGGAALLTAAMLVVLGWWLSPVPWWYLALLAVAASEAAFAVANGAAHMHVAPARLPRLDFSDGVPDDCRTLVVVPALLFSTRTIDALLQRLEINYLANRDRNLLFALLTDAADSTAPTGDDEVLGRACAEGIRALNDRYGQDRPFYLLHRARSWNAAEGVWMGRERKRGKLDGLNAWLLGGVEDPFTIKEGDLAALGAIRYVITLDADTQVPLNAARTLVAAAAHPLNRPVFDPVRQVVREGYAILQPRVSVSADSASRSRLAAIRSGAIGVDPYATAVSDVYQDVHGRANFTGKGLYDLAAYHRALGGRFPDNALLSHDLIEGEHARVGLVSDVELVDDYPANYEVYSKRKHRWTRGDWQLLYWLLPRVPDGASAWVPNPLSALSRWKIFDNLRRSTLELSLALALAAAWLLLPGHGPRATLAVAALLLAGGYSDLAFSLRHLPPRRLLRGFAREKAIGLVRAHVDALISVAMTLHQALLMADAIGRTLVRRLITHRRLLEWETTAQAESVSGARPSVATRYMKMTPVVAAALLVAAPAMRTHAAGLALAGLWIASPLAASWLSRSGARRFAWNASEATFLRGVALRIWRHVDEWSDGSHHWLVPDTVQEAEDGRERVAWQTSPTNVGLQLAATTAAREFGYLTARETAEACARVLDVLDRLERCRGHFYNWYDTRTLEPLAPRYVSTVDSGNLSASLLAVKQGSLAARTQPIVSADTLGGLRDHAVRVRNALPRRLRRRAVARSITAMLRRVEQEPADLFAWGRLLAGLRPLAIAVNEWLRVADSPAAWRIRESGVRGQRSDVADAQAWAERLVTRVDETARELRRFAPWVDTPDLHELPPALLDVLAQVPSPSAAVAHYDTIDRQARAALAGGDAPLWWRLHARLRRQVAAARVAAEETDRALGAVAERCGRLAVEPDFRFLFDPRQKLLRLGFDADTGEIDSSCYDLLASEARTAVLLAIAKRDIPREAWFHLGRKLVASGRDRVLVSWGGTMFEHLMPLLFMRSFDPSLLHASARAMVRTQEEWGRAHGVPWGFSEAACATLEDSGRYAYRTFGVPAAAMKQMAPGEMVVAPYAAALALMVDPGAAADNLRLMAAKGWLGRYGFYESVDYTTESSTTRPRGVIVRSFMAHHQGMTMLALCNAVLDGRVQARFHADPLVAAAERLLQERLPTRLPAGEADLDVTAAVPARARVRGATPADAVEPHTAPAHLGSGFSFLRLSVDEKRTRRRRRRWRMRLSPQSTHRQVQSG